MIKKLLRKSQRIRPALTHRIVGTVTSVSTLEPVVALTFDDGPHPQFTPSLLDVLKKHNARATFFMVGQMAAQYPEIVQQVAADGHTIGNHSWDHPSFPLVSSRERRHQIQQCAAALAPYGQRLFRPPYGHQNLASRLDALWLGYQVVTWNVVTYDWLDHNADWITHYVSEQLQPGSIVLFHDALFHTLEEQYLDRTPTIEAVDMLLTEFQEKFRFLTVPELLHLGRPHRRNWEKHPDMNWLASLKQQSLIF